jgi:ATP-dependent HslUV protease subunit HslV
MTLFERLEMKLQEHPETMRACVEMAKAWRMDKYLRRLEAIMIVCDKDVSLTLTGTGDVIEPEKGVIGIGSGGAFASAAALALVDVEGYSAEMIGRKAMDIASDMCVYTNKNYVTELLDAAIPPATPSAP